MIKGVTRNTRSGTSTKKKNKIVLDSVWGRRCGELQFCAEKTEGGKSKPAVMCRESQSLHNGATVSPLLLNS